MYQECVRNVVKQVIDDLAIHHVPFSIQHIAAKVKSTIIATYEDVKQAAIAELQVFGDAIPKFRFKGMTVYYWASMTEEDAKEIVFGNDNVSISEEWIEAKHLVNSFPLNTTSLDRIILSAKVLDRLSLDRDEDYHSGEILDILVFIGRFHKMWDQEVICIPKNQIVLKRVLLESMPGTFLHKQYTIWGSRQTALNNPGISLPVLVETGNFNFIL